MSILLTLNGVTTNPAVPYNTVTYKFGGGVTADQLYYSENGIRNICYATTNHFSIKRDGTWVVIADRCVRDTIFQNAFETGTVSLTKPVAAKHTGKVAHKPSGKKSGAKTTKHHVAETQR